PSISGFSFLGGEPLDQLNDDTLLRTVKAIKAQTDKTIWLWTGYVFENLSEKQMEIVKHIDILVDGPFIEAQKDMRLLFRGSANQRIIDIQKSLQENKTVLWEKQ
ncbi:MAG: radical SAM protein, partial [Oscillospiraceae bacterium]|nr:radical SAM protein [Oscillospiraceae bacterium]